MSRLVLKFEGSELKEVPLGTRPVTIGRAPEQRYPHRQSRSIQLSRASLCGGGFIGG